MINDFDEKSLQKVVDIRRKKSNNIDENDKGSTKVTFDFKNGEEKGEN